MKDVICWWSGGITSAVACKLAINIYGKENCRVIMIDTHNEHDDTYRFKDDCSKWYGIEIESISRIGDRYENITDVWKRFKTLNNASGAICSSELKRETREKWERDNEFSHQVFGFEFETKEFKRALSLKLNHSHTNPLFPLIMYGLNKSDCIDYIIKAGIEPPEAYKMGFQNNNCLKTGCVQGGIGYWKKMQEEQPHLFDKMAAMEHELTELKGQQVTMLKDQSNEAKKKSKDLNDKGVVRVFLKSHPDYPDNKCIDDMKGRPVEPLMECNGFCGVNDLLPKNQTEMEI
jgi:3'-phosphoadenosine 5'-phosphosulfate sulfotransferase (PAPS reductase)/FAD synthetase